MQMNRIQYGRHSLLEQLKEFLLQFSSDGYPEAEKALLDFKAQNADLLTQLGRLQAAYDLKKRMSRKCSPAETKHAELLTQVLKNELNEEDRPFEPKKSQWVQNPDLILKRRAKTKGRTYSTEYIERNPK
jgi:hypothetical protein